MIILKARIFPKNHNFTKIVLLTLSKLFVQLQCYKRKINGSTNATKLTKLFFLIQKVTVCNSPISHKKKGKFKHPKLLNLHLKKNHLVT